MSSIFLSHSSKDNAASEQLKAQLEQLGHRSIFLDFDPANGIPAGRDWEKELYARLRECRAVIILCSRTSMASRWCFAEITHAKALGKPVLPVKIDDCQIDALLTDVQIIDAAAGWNNAYDRLADGLKKVGLDPKDLFDWDNTRPPYPGLLAFQEQDAAIFFGRNKDIREGQALLNRLQQFGGPRLTVVLGASGSGKSSLMRAGLVPRLKRDPRWLVIEPFRPLKAPFDELARSLSQCFGQLKKPESGTPVDFARVQDKIRWRGNDAANSVNAFLDLIRELTETTASRDMTVLLTIDQCEELLGLGASEEGHHFLSFLRAVLDRDDSHLMVVTTLRSDFLGSFQEEPAMRGLSVETFPLRQMDIEDFASVIEGPAQVAGFQIGPGLVQAMVNDTKTSDALPLMAFTLRELWEGFGEDQLLTLDEYRDKLGGLEGAIARVAETVLNSKSSSEQELADLRIAFLSMVRINDKDQYAKQPAQWKDLPVAIHNVLERFVTARLLVSSGDTNNRMLEVVHEALFRAWPRLSDWLKENKRFLAWRKRFEETAKHWEYKQIYQYHEDLLLRGGPLAEAMDWISKQHVALDPAQKKFLDESLSLRHRQERWRRAAMITSVSLAMVFLLVAAGAGLQWIKTKEQLATHYWSQAVSAKKGDDRLRAAHFFAKAAKEFGAVLTYTSFIAQFGIRKQQRQEVVSQFEASLLNVQIDSQEIVLGQVLQHQGGILGVVISQDHQRLLTWSDDHTARLWQTKDGAPIGQPMKHGGSVQGARFSQDEQRVLTWSDDHTARLWQTKDGAPIGQPMKHGGSVQGARFSQDEQRVLTWSDDHTARLWQTKDGAPVGQPMKHDGPVQGAVFSQDEQRILTWSHDHTARLWRAKDGAPVGQPMKHDGPVQGAVFSQDEQRILTWSHDHTARLWRAKDGAPVGQPMKHSRPLWGARFSQDEQRILTWSHDHTARLWRAKDGAPIGQPMKHDTSEYGVFGAVFSKDEQRVLTWSDDHTARLWRAKDGVPIGQPMKHSGTVWGATFLEDDHGILTWSLDGTARLWLAKDGAPAGQPMKHDESVLGATFVEDDHRILTWSLDGTARLWQTRDGAPVGQPMKHDIPSLLAHLLHSSPIVDVQGARFSKEKRLLTWGGGTVRLWQVKDEGPFGQPMKHDGPVWGARFSKDEQRILTWSDDGMARLWQVKDEGPFGQPMKHDGPVWGARFSKDEQRILTWSHDHTARLWQTKDGAPVGQPMKHGGPVLGAKFSKDEQRILTWSDDGTARLWQTKDGAPVGQPMKHSGPVLGATFTENDQEILTWSHDHTARLWQTKDGAPVGQSMKHGGPVRGARLSKDEQRILTWSDDQIARLWQAKDGAPVGQPMKHNASDSQIFIGGAVFSEDEKRVLTWSGDGARLWRAKDGAPIGQPMKHDGFGVEGATFSKDEQWVLTWSLRTVRLWQAKDGAPVGQPIKHGGSVLGARFSRDEQRILTWSNDQTAQLWRAKDGVPIGQPMKHRGPVLGAVFSKDEQRVLTWSDDQTARVWNANVDYDFPFEDISLLVEILTGTTMDNFGNIGVLNSQDWSERRKGYINIAKKHLQTCEFKTANIFETQKHLWGIGQNQGQERDSQQQEF